MRCYSVERDSAEREAISHVNALPSSRSLMPSLFQVERKVISHIRSVATITKDRDFLQVFYAARRYSRGLEERDRKDGAAETVSILILLIVLLLLGFFTATRIYRPNLFISRVLYRFVLGDSTCIRIVIGEIH